MNKFFFENVDELVEAARTESEGRFLVITNVRETWEVDIRPVLLGAFERLGLVERHKYDVFMLRTGAQVKYLYGGAEVQITRALRGRSPDGILVVEVPGFRSARGLWQELGRLKMFRRER